MKLPVALSLLATVTAYGAYAPPQWPAAVQKIAPEAAVRSPADALATFSLPPGYRLELVASEPLVQDPILIEWDAYGRLWVVELPGYMRDITSRGEHDPVGRIVVLEDTDGDSRMDKRTVFADTLVQPRALKLVIQGVLVGEPPNIWLLKDADGDLHADAKELVARGYGQVDTNVEVNANGLYWSLDNRIYTSGTGADLYLRFKNGKFEPHRSLSRGQWGITGDDTGRIYRNHNESVLHVDVVPTPYFARHPTLLRTRGSHDALTDPGGNINAVWPAHQTPGTNRAYQHGVLRDDGTLASFTAACAPTVYRGGALPADVTGSVFVAEPAANVVSRIVVFDDGRSLRARKAYDRAEFLSSTDERFRPVHLANGPDGALYVVDLYRGIIQHRTYITEYLRDQIAERKLEQPTGLGRIYRVVYGSTRPALERLSPLASSAELVPKLRHDNGWWRDTAQRLLLELGDTSIVPSLVTLAEDTTSGAGRLHALWTLDGLDAIEQSTIVKALDAESRDVRVAAIRIAERWFGDPANAALAAALKRIDDPDWAVRQQLAASIGELQSGGAREQVAARILAQHADDPVVTDATLSGLRGSEFAVLAALLNETADHTSPRETAIAMLTATIVRGGQADVVERTIARVAEDSVARWKRAALLRGAEIALIGAAMPGSTATRASAAAAGAPCPTCAGGRAGPGGAYAFPRPADWPTAAGGRGGGPRLTLSREPVLLSKLAVSGDALSARAAGVLTRIDWPGKPGAAAPVAPLTADEQRRFEAGREVYRNICQACHQADGRGQDRLAPSLIGSPFALAAADIPVRILLHGKEGSVGLMPPIGNSLSDDGLAGVLTYIRREWGHTAAPVDPETVRAVRAATAARKKPWTEPELLVRR